LVFYAILLALAGQILPLGAFALRISKFPST